MKILVICEKPSVSRRIASALCDKPKVERYGKVTYFKFKKGEDEVIVAPSVGHLFTLREKKKSFPSFDLEWAPTYIVDKSARYMKPYADALQKLAKDCDLYVNATDYDIEGHLIGWNIIRFFGHLDRAKRMKFSTLTDEELRKAFENLEPINKYHALAGETRHMIDWMYGINLSRAIMRALSKAGRRYTLSIGRVQGPFLKFLAEREEEIRAFVPKEYWEILAYISKIPFVSKTKFEKEEDARETYNSLEKEGELNIEEKEKIIPQPVPLDFTTLQVEAYRVLGFTPVKTQSLAQELYENAMISYPRTSSQKLPQSINFRQIIERLSGRFDAAKEIVKLGRFRPREGKAEDPAHPAIYPTGRFNKVSEDANKLYDLIVRRFLSSFHLPAKVVEKNAKLKIGKLEFDAKWIEMQDEGWLKIYPFSAPELRKPEIKSGKVKVDKFEIAKRKTKAPSRYTPASIIKLLDELNIGTKTTRAIILDTLYKRGYITGRKIVVTPLGMAVYKIFSHYSPKVVDPDLTRKLEQEMDMIQERKISQSEVIEEAKRILTEIIENMMKNEEEIGKELLKNLKETEVFAPCKCGGSLRIIKKSGKRFLGCTNYPECKITYSLPPKGLISYGGECEKCGSPTIWIISDKRRYRICLNRECVGKEKEEKRKGEKAMKAGKKTSKTSKKR